MQQHLITQSFEETNQRLNKHRLKLRMFLLCTADLQLFQQRELNLYNLIKCIPSSHFVRRSKGVALRSGVISNFSLTIDKINPKVEIEKCPEETEATL